MWSAEEEITEFLEPLLARLSEVLGRRGSVESQLSALGAISSAAAAARTGFRPYAAAVLPLLRSYMNITEVSVHSVCPSSRLLEILSSFRGHGMRVSAFHSAQSEFIFCIAPGEPMSPVPVFCVPRRVICCRAGRARQRQWASSHATWARKRWAPPSPTLWQWPCRCVFALQKSIIIHLCSGLP